MRTSILNGLGPALRWLRDRRGKKQYQVAGSAGITKGMLSAYETGRQKPSLETLDKILDTLACDLNDLHNALQIVNGRPEAMIRPGGPDAGQWERPRDGGTGVGPPDPGGRADVDVYQSLGFTRPLPVAEEQAFTAMLEGFHRLLRYLHENLPRPRSSGEEPPVATD